MPKRPSLCLIPVERVPRSTGKAEFSETQRGALDRFLIPVDIHSGEGIIIWFI
jgi:hypothetical protein